MLWNDPFMPLVGQLSGFTPFVPAADVTVSDGDMVLTMDVPGLTVEDLSIELLDGYLFVRGERKPPELAEGTEWQHTERPFGRFERRVKVPEGVDADGITATMDNGVLSLIVPKPERLKPRSIVIGSGDGRRRLQTATA
jgi:HSP20 family protein